MSNQITRSLIKNIINDFCSSFETSKENFWDEKKRRLIHPGEFGIFREQIVIKFLKLLLPSKYSFGSGFILSNTGYVSPQCDIIIYDKESNPIENDMHQKFFPIETVVGLGEIKSDIKTKKELNKYLEVLAEVKYQRTLIKEPTPKNELYNFDPKSDSFDQLFTFLICNRFNFKVSETNTVEYPQKYNRYKHNLIMSINDGLLLYKTSHGTKNLWFPFNGNIDHENYWVKRDSKEISSHWLVFIVGMNNGINMTTILQPDMTLYITDHLYERII